MKRSNENNKFSRSILMFSNRLQNCSTQKKSNNKSGKDINNKISVTLFNNSITQNSKPNIYQAPRKINRCSSFIDSKSNNNKIFSVYKLFSKKSIAEFSAPKNDMSQIPISQNKNIKTSIMNYCQKTPTKVKNKFYSPSSPYTPSISSTSRQPNTNNNNYSRRMPTFFNAFITPSKKIEVNQSEIQKYKEPKDIFKEKMDLFVDNLYKEISKLCKRFAGIEYNKGMQLAEANQNYIIKMKELYEQREKQMINVIDKYQYELDSLKFCERKKYMELYKSRAKELAQIDENFNFEKEQIKIKYQMDYDLIKNREENEIKKVLEKKIIEKARNKLLKLINYN